MSTLTKLKDDLERACTWQQTMGAIHKHFSVEEEQTATSGNLSSFDQIIENRIKQIRSVLSKKAEEYASKTDRFHNFRVAARKMNTTPEIALQGMMAKHEVAVLDMIEAPENVTKEMIDEKIGDNINYLILLEGLLKERIHHG